MSSHPGHYDENLLASAPIATKEQLQEGYNPDILNPNRKANSSPPTPLRHPEAGLPSKEYVTLAPARLPFWRTTRGRIIIAIAVIVVIAAVVGGAVGGTHHKGSSSLGTAVGDSQNGTSNTSEQSGQPTLSQSTVSPQSQGGQAAPSTTPSGLFPSTPVGPSDQPPTQTTSAGQRDISSLPFP